MASPPPVVDANPVALKVMRLCKPSLHFSMPVPFPPLPPPDGEPQPGVALSGMLTLPQSFGDIYLGETFSCYISLSNTSSIDLAHVGLKVEVQTQLQRETLADSSISETAISRFAPSQTLDKIIEYELKDVGIHILICSALYTDSTGERKYFRKFFKFQVNNPLSMKSKTHAMPPPLNEILVETQLQNAMPRQIFLQSVDFRPAPQFDAEDLNTFAPSLSAAPLGTTIESPEASSSTDYPVSSDVGLPSFGSLAYLKAGDTQQYMFRLRGKVPPNQLRQVSTLGRMDVVWRTSMGESGRLQSNTVQRKLPPNKGVEVTLTTAPPQVDLQTPFELQCEVSNTSGSEVQLQLTMPMTATASFLLDGLTTRNLGTLAAGASMPLTLRCIALEPGMARIGGMQLVDALTEKVYEVGQLADVFVLNDAGEEVVDLS